MGTIELPKKSSAHQPKKASHDVPDPLNFDKQQLVAGILAQETGRIVSHLSARLTRESFAVIDAHGGARERLRCCLEEIFQKVFCGYLETSDGKDLCNSIEWDGVRASSPHSPREIARLLSSGDSTQRFNAGEIEKALTAGTDAADDLDALADSILRQRSDAFFTDNACTVVKCVFRDNALKPKTVTDVKLCVNIADPELIDPLFRYYATAKYLIKDLVSPHIIDAIDREIESYDREDSDAAAEAVAYAMAHDPTLAEAFVERIVERGAKIDSAHFDAANIRLGIRKNTDIENICSQGFGVAVNYLAAILDASKLSYQFLEYEHSGHKVTIREYEDADPTGLPDEHYQITLRFLDDGQLAEERNAYDAQFKAFEGDVQHLWDIIEVIYQDSKSVFKVNDFEDLAKKNKSRIKHLLKDRTGDPQYGNTVRDWDDSAGIRSGKESIHARLVRMRERITNMTEFLYTVERRVVEEQLSRFEKEYIRMDSMTNPNLLQSGLVIDVDVTSIKRKKTTLDSIALALEEFLRNASRGYREAALAAFGKDFAAATLPVKASPRR